MPCRSVGLPPLGRGGQIQLLLQLFALQARLPALARRAALAVLPERPGQRRFRQHVDPRSLVALARFDHARPLAGSHHRLQLCDDAVPDMAEDLPQLLHREVAVLQRRLGLERPAGAPLPVHDLQVRAAHDDLDLLGRGQHIPFADQTEHLHCLHRFPSNASMTAMYPHQCPCPRKDSRGRRSSACKRHAFRATSVCFDPSNGEHMHRPVIGCAALALVLSMPAPAKSPSRAKVPSSDEKEIQSFVLTTGFLDKMVAIQESATRLEETHPELKKQAEASQHRGEDDNSLYGMVKRIESVPQSVKIIKAQGLTPRQYMVGTMALVQVSFYWAFKKQTPDLKAPEGMNMPNVAFIETHQAELEKFQQRMDAIKSKPKNDAPVEEQENKDDAK